MGFENKRQKKICQILLMQFFPSMVKGFTNKSTTLTNLDLKFLPNVTKAPVKWSRLPETTLPMRQLYLVFICENIVSVSRVKVVPA